MSEPIKHPSAVYREEFLDIVKGLVTKDRSATHGQPEDNFKDIADMWNVLFEPNKPFTSKDVATAMICVKLARIKHSPNKFDHWHDIAGYAACAGGIIMTEKNHEE